MIDGNHTIDGNKGIHWIQWIEGNHGIDWITGWRGNTGLTLTK